MYTLTSAGRHGKDIAVMTVIQRLQSTIIITGTVAVITTSSPLIPPPTTTTPLPLPLLPLPLQLLTLLLNRNGNLYLCPG